MNGKEIFWHALSLPEVEKELSANFKEGLKETEVKERHRLFGLNVLKEEKSYSSFRLFLRQFESPLIYILVIAGVITLFLKDYTDSAVIWVTVFLNVVIGFFQEKKASKILSELQKIIKVKAYVIREGNEKEIDQSETAPGDVFLLRPGYKVPADGRLIESFHLKINEAVLTGEWMPAEKEIRVLDEKTPLADRDNMVYMGCIVEEGQGMAVATATAEKTKIEKFTTLVENAEEKKRLIRSE